VADNLVNLDDMRKILVLFMAERPENTLVSYMTLWCIDLCLQQNIDALCGTQGHMHDVCLLHKYIMDEPSQSDEHTKCKSISEYAMHHRTTFSHENVFGKVLQQFCRPQTSICRAIWKKQVIASLESHWQLGLDSGRGNVDIEQSGFATLFPFAKQYLFSPERVSNFVFGLASEDLYEEDRLRAMLRTILFAMTARKALNLESAHQIWNYQTDRAARQHLDLNSGEFFRENLLIGLLMTQNKHSPDYIYKQIEELWTTMCGAQSQSTFV